jgi:hypothetical protein
MADTSGPLRRMLLGLLVLGLSGLSVELLLLDHYESWSQAIPFGSILLGFAAIGWHVVAKSAPSVSGIRVSMVLLVGVGLVGVVLHYQGNMAFQLEMDPAQSSWSLFTKVMHAHAPPALAPAAMAQLGLLGLAYAWRHPATRASVRGGERT